MYEHFAAIPWCRELLGRDDVVWLLPRSRVLKASREDQLVASTLNTPDTVAAFLLFHRRPESETARIDEMGALLTIGGGMNGFPDTCHGGIVATIIDEAMGAFIEINQRRRAISRAPHMTAYLNTTFVRPVPTPSTILCMVRIDRIEGRKLYVGATIENERREVLSRGEALFVALKQRL